MRSSIRNRFLGSIASAAILMGVVASPTPAAGPTVAPKVVGGGPVTVADLPWQVLFIIDGTNVCGGSLVSPTQILSAAHCFDGQPTEKVKLWAGITRMEDRGPNNELSIASILKHEGYNATTFANDIALVTLKAPVPASVETGTIDLPSTQNAATWPADQSTAIVSGWGETDPSNPVAANQLQGANVTILSGPQSTICGNYGAQYISTLQLCAGAVAGGIDACQGDSGGPLTVFIDNEPVLAGIASTGYQCAVAGYPGLYVRTTSYLPWLASKGVDINRKAATADVARPGTSKDGSSANFRVGSTYERAVFAKFAKLSPTKSRLKVTGGVACVQAGQTVTFERNGKCRMTMTQGKKSIPLVVTIY